jgi:hypothetical protein
MTNPVFATAACRGSSAGFSSTAIGLHLIPLTYRDKGSSGTQLAIYSHELCIGHLHKEMMSQMAGRTPFWSWTFGLSTAVPKGFPVHGNTNSLEEAKEIIERSWEEWFAAAGLTDSHAPRS